MLNIAFDPIRAGGKVLANFELVSDEPLRLGAVRWGIAAIACGALAVFSANIGHLVPGHLIAGLHTTRVQGGSFNQMRAQLTQLRSENARLTSAYRALASRFDLLDSDRGETIRRLAAVEQSLPLLIESLPPGTDIDRSLLTAAIARTAGEVYEADGGMIKVRHSPLFEGIVVEGATEEPPAQPLPAPIPKERQPMPVSVDQSESGAPTYLQGIAVGAVVAPGSVDESYQAIIEKAGTLLLGTQPLMVDGGDEERTRVLLGPLAGRSAALDLCARLEVLDLACDPMPYRGLDWPN